MKRVKEHKTTVVHCKRAPYDIYIGGSSFWGNPYQIGKDGTRAEVLQKYENWIKTQPDHLQRLKELRGKKLGCYCKPDYACHGDILARLADEGFQATFEDFSGRETCSEMSF